MILCGRRRASDVGQRASDPGVDIDFLELAEFFYELDAASCRAASSGSVALADVR
jgi:hypothetical protein